ncbi:DUF7345 domain-containing protein [Salinilacihabitans rarus]|uniref:DUF7345 domain-containing protein n=1 Tax=Salinilacihabitans rarus TaxID=2961596 RepID=UPI0020C86E1A|nr:hypothetical protein [Salinilacihabitans rarus]
MISTVDTRTARRTARTWGIVALVLLAAVATPAAAQTGTQAQLTTDTTEPAFVVALHEDGSADVTVTMTYDLTDENAAFESLRNNSTVQQNAAETFAERLRSVAANASEATGREMSVSDPSISLSTADGGSVGVITLQVRWHGLAAVDGDTLHVSEPFASGFTPERPFTLVEPDGYELTDATPEPADTTADGATWAAGTSLEGFSATFEPSTASTSGGDALPGFGPVAGLVAVSAGAALLARRSAS